MPNIVETAKNPPSRGQVEAIAGMAETG